MKTLAQSSLAIAGLSIGSYAIALSEPPILPNGGAGDAQSNEGHAVSADGRFVAFSTYATNLVVNDTNGSQDVFLWDRETATVTLVSRSTAGVAGNGDSSLAVVSADGAWVAFLSVASNLAPDTNGTAPDVFLYSRLTEELRLVSISSAGLQSSSGADNPDISANGRYITFDAIGELANGAGTAVRNVFRRDNWSSVTALVSQTPAGVAADNMSFNAQMSADGERIVFVSMGTDLVETPTVGKDAFLFDARSGVTSLLSLNAAGEAGDGTSYFPTISGDGKVAAFHSYAGNLFADNAEGIADVVVRDLQTGALELISQTANQTAADSDSIHPALDFTGNRVAYTTFAGNLVPNATPGRGDVMVFDRAAQSTQRLSESAAGVGGNGDSGSSAISLNGGTVALMSRASDLSSNGTAFGDLLVVDVVTNVTSFPVVAAAILPSSRSAQIGTSFTAFASVIGTEIIGGCTVALDTTLDIAMSYQLTNPLTNEATGPLNSEFLLLPGVPQTMVLLLQPNVALTEEELEFSVSCDLGSAAVVPGTNTLLVSAESSQPPDVVALAATVDNDGIITLPSGSPGGFFSAASVNVGSASSFTVRPVVLGQPLDAVSVCQTNPVSGVCLAAPAATVSALIDSGDTPTFGVFATNAEDVVFAPAVNRLVLQFEDGAGTIRGRTSVAVQSEP